MRPSLKTTIVQSLLFLLLSGCMTSPLSAPTEKPTEEIFVALPDGFTVGGCLAIREEILRMVESAPVGTSLTFFMGDSQNLVGTITILKGSTLYRRKIANRELAMVWEILDPEKTGGDQAIDLISIPATIRKYRKSDLNAHVILIGSPLIKDREQGNDVGKEYIPCDGCILDPQTSYGRMETFPAGTKVSWLIPRPDYGNGPNHRSQVEHFLRCLLQTKGGPLARMSSDPGVVFNSNIKSQWSEDVVPQDDCNGKKEVTPDDLLKEFDNEGNKIVNFSPDLSVKARAPKITLLKGPTEQVVFLIDTSASVRDYFNVIVMDVCEKLESMPLKKFAICGFGGDRSHKPRLAKYPNSIFSGLYWEDATPANRQKAIQFVKNLQVNGGTPTLDALIEAGKLEGPMTVLLFTDGIPTIGKGTQSTVVKYARELAEKKQATINTVGVGALSAANDNFDWSGAHFLALMADGSGGEYFALTEE